MVCVYKEYIIQENDRLFRKQPFPGPPLSLPEQSKEIEANLRQIARRLKQAWRHATSCKWKAIPEEVPRMRLEA